MSRRVIAAIAALLGACTLADDPAPPGEGDEGAGPRLLEVDLERMIYQARYDLWEACAYFPDGKVMREPPAGTVPHGEVDLGPAVTAGLTDVGDYVARVPLELTMDVLRRGQDRFGIYCSPCHGVTGNGVSQVAKVMQLRPPPSLVEGRVAEYPPGRIFQVIDNGYGLMRSYSADLPLMDRWAVVAYVQALQRARGVDLDALPPALRARALSELP